MIYLVRWFGMTIKAQLFSKHYSPDFFLTLKYRKSLTMYVNNLRRRIRNTSICMKTGSISSTDKLTIFITSGEIIIHHGFKRRKFAIIPLRLDDSWKFFPSESPWHSGVLFTTGFHEARNVMSLANNQWFVTSKYLYCWWDVWQQYQIVN